MMPAEICWLLTFVNCRHAVLSKLTAMRTATVKLSVPLFAAFSGMAFLPEAITPRLVAASIMILGGIAMALTSKSRT
jgi:drug/metabolite transporter (DMT)-like permease